MDILTLVLVSAGSIILAGHNVRAIISTSIARGKAPGLQTVAGTTCTMTLRLFVAAIGTTWLVSAFTSGYLWLIWLAATLDCGYAIRSGKIYAQSASPASVRFQHLFSGIMFFGRRRVIQNDRCRAEISSEQSIHKGVRFFPVLFADAL